MADTPILETSDEAFEEGEFQTDLSATEQPQPDEQIEFHVQMRSFTRRELEAFIVEAAARQIVKGEPTLIKAIEARCVELTSKKADAVLSRVTTEIINQPMTPKFGKAEPVTMGEFLGLYGREYLTQKVGRDGKPSEGGYGSSAVTRIQYLVAREMDTNFERDIKAATNATIREIEAETKARHTALLDAEKARLREALTKLTA